MSEWPVLSLREAGVSLIDCEHRTPPASTSGRPYIAIPQIKHGRIDLSDARLISEQHFADWTKKAKPKAFDVILSRRCNPGETAVVPPDLECALGQNLVLLRSDGSRVDARFLRWLVRGDAWWREVQRFLNVGAVFDSLKCADIPKFKLQIPPLSEQRRIAEILGALDDKIELNRRMNETLEAIARALFDAAFTNEEHLSEWAVNPLDRVARFTNGLALQKFPATAGDPGLPVIKIAQLRAGHTGAADVASSRLTPDYIVEDGDLLFSWSGSLECAIWTGGRGALNQHLFKVTSELYPQWYVYFWIHKHLPEFRHIAASKATTMGHIQRRHLHESQVVVPDQATMRRLDDVIAPLISRTIANRLESRTLAQLRDTLLPKLLSGEIRVAAAEKELAAHV